MMSVLIEKKLSLSLYLSSTNTEDIKSLNGISPVLRYILVKCGLIFLKPMISKWGLNSAVSGVTEKMYLTTISIMPIPRQ